MILYKKKCSTVFFFTFNTFSVIFVSPSSPYFPHSIIMNSWFVAPFVAFFLFLQHKNKGGLNEFLHARFCLHFALILDRVGLGTFYYTFQSSKYVLPHQYSCLINWEEHLFGGLIDDRDDDWSHVTHMMQFFSLQKQILINGVFIVYSFFSHHYYSYCWL